MATRPSTRRPARSPSPKLIEARALVAASLSDVRDAAALLRTTLPMTFDALPDCANVQDFVAVAKAAQKRIDAAQTTTRSAHDDRLPLGFEGLGQPQD